MDEVNFKEQYQQDREEKRRLYVEEHKISWKNIKRDIKRDWLEYSTKKMLWYEHWRIVIVFIIQMALIVLLGFSYLCVIVGVGYWLIQTLVDLL